MRIEKISKDKIKIMIDGNEAKAWNISFKNISENTPEAQKMFWTALRLAEKNVDFSLQGAKLFVEAVKDEAQEDGFGMLVTRVCSEEELKTAISNCGYRGRLKRTELKAQLNRQAIYRFRDFDAVCNAAEQMKDFYEGKSVLYKCDGAFYLYLVPAYAEISEELAALLLEFASRVQNEQYIHGRLNEYGEKMIPDRAIEVMQEYFCVR